MSLMLNLKNWYNKDNTSFKVSTVENKTYTGLHQLMNLRIYCKTLSRALS